MSIAIIVTDRNVEALRRQIKAHLPEEVEVLIYPDIPHPEQVEMAILWKHPTGILKNFPQLKLISSLGAGVEHILNDPTMPKRILITRIVDEALVVSMRNYVLMAVLNIQRKSLFYQQRQWERRWEKPEQTERSLTIGLLGLGELGRAIAQTLADLGFTVLGYSRSPKVIEDIQSYCHADLSLTDFVKKINTLICLLPMTPQTRDILNYSLFRNLPQGSFLVNAARGAQLVEADLLRAMEEGIIEEAYLDVFREEPLPPEHPFWLHPRIVITPHIASITDQENAARITAENYLRMKGNEELLFQVNIDRGY